MDERDHRIDEALRDRVARKQYKTQTLIMNVNKQLNNVANQQRGFLSVRKIRVPSRAKILPKQVMPKISARVIVGDS